MSHENAAEKEMIGFLYEINKERKKEKQTTRTPIYIVYDLQECFFCDSFTEEVNEECEIFNSNLKGKKAEKGFVVTLTGEDIEPFYIPALDEEQIYDSVCSTIRYWTDLFVAIFFTRKEAENYLQRQTHNLNEAYIYEAYPGYRNIQMDKFFCLLEKI